MGKSKKEKPQVVEDVAEDRSAYNCPECKGEGLDIHNKICPSCQGTGKV